MNFSAYFQESNTYNINKSINFFNIKITIIYLRPYYA